MPDRRRARLVLVLSALGLLACALALLRSHPAPVRADGKRTEEVQGIPELEGAEALTQRSLAAIEARLRERLEGRASQGLEAWRMRLIRFSMWGPVAPVTAWTLETLGESATARRVLFFLMPLVRWMSEPFLFPVETGGTAAERDREIDRLFAFTEKRAARGLCTSLDNVGDASLSAADAEAYRGYYLALIRRFAQAGNRGPGELALSLKLSALTHDLDTALQTDDAGQEKRAGIKAALRDLLAAAASSDPDRPVFVRIDMEEYAYKDLTLRLFRETVDENPDLARDGQGGLRLGVVIQAYLRDAARDVQALTRWARARGVRVPIRLVKGAYLEHEREAAREAGRRSPVWDHKASTDASYEDVAALMLLSPDAVRPAFATHNLRSQAHVMALASLCGSERAATELQMLYGMGEPIKHVLVEMGYPVREYVPAGGLARGLAYAGRRFRELASGDNALARTLHGDFSAVEGGPPAFVGREDIEDGAAVQAILQEAVRGRSR